MKNKKGFTLVEVIISIAALGIVCAVLLRLFVLAGDTNRHAGDVQNASLYVTSTAEVLAGADTLCDAFDALGISHADDIADGRYTFSQDGYDIAIEIEEQNDGYPGTLYDLDISAVSGQQTLADIHTAKYYKEQTHD